MATNYARGRQFEYAVRDHFQKLGYWVIRSAQSRTPADVVALGAVRVFAVQCKRDGKIGPREWNTLFDLAQSVNAMPVVAKRGKRGEGIQIWQLVDRKKVDRAKGGKRLRPLQPWVQITVYANPTADISGSALQIRPGRTQAVAN